MEEYIWLGFGGILIAIGIAIALFVRKSNQNERLLIKRRLDDEFAQAEKVNSNLDIDSLIAKGNEGRKP